MDVTTNLSGFKKDITKPSIKLPRGACDAHMHIIGPFSSFPLVETKTLYPGEAILEDFLSRQKILGLDRCVVVQPSFYGTDNSCTLNAVARMGNDARAVVVIDPEISDEELRRLHEAGARGIRLQRVVSGGINPQKIAQMAERLAPLGWHIQLFVGEEFFLDCPVDLNDLPVPVVIDHMAHFDPSQGTDGAGFRAFMRLLERGNVWAKISNCFFHAAIERARALVTTNPERCMWGSDWPHVVFRGPAPDDGALVDDLEAICGDEHTLELVVARNAGKLYFNEAA
jgi:predicted TIM-barrel fold metal-dependent hydrolase